MVPPSTRRRLANTSSQIARVVKSGALWSGKGIYVLSTSLLMVGIPWALAFADEQQLMEVEREQKARETAGEVSRNIFFANLENVTLGFFILEDRGDIYSRGGCCCRAGYS